MSAPRHLPIVGVIGSGSDAVPEAAELGAWLAGEGVHLVTGGGAGVMTAVSEAFHGARPRGARGVVIGILPASSSDRAQPKRGYPNPWVEVPIRTHLPLSGERGQEDLSRNHLVVLTAQMIVAMPGQSGTSSEVALALRYGRPIVAFLPPGTTIPNLPATGVAVLRRLADVKRAVRAELGTASTRSGRTRPR